LLFERPTYLLLLGLGVSSLDGIADAVDPEVVAVADLARRRTARVPPEHRGRGARNARRAQFPDLELAAQLLTGRSAGYPREFTVSANAALAAGEASG
jgi:hypothetical protein